MVKLAEEEIELMKALPTYLGQGFNEDIVIGKPL